MRLQLPTRYSQQAHGIFNFTSLQCRLAGKPTIIPPCVMALGLGPISKGWRCDEQRPRSPHRHPSSLNAAVIDQHSTILSLAPLAWIGLLGCRIRYGKTRGRGYGYSTIPSLSAFPTGPPPVISHFQPSLTYAVPLAEVCNSVPNDNAHLAKRAKYGMALQNHLQLPFLRNVKPYNLCSRYCSVSALSRIQKHHIAGEGCHAPLPLSLAA